MITPVRWLGPLCAGLAAAAIAWMASSLAGRRRTAWISGTLFCVWLSAYQYAAALSPDGIHAFLAVTALGVTSGWRSSQRASVAVLAGALWIAVQILRPTFFPLALISPILLWKRGGSRRYAGISLALWGSSLLVPGFIIGSNWVHHDVAIISRVGYDNLACTAGPRLSEQRGQGNYHQLKKECLRHFRSFPIKQRAKLQSDRALREFKQYPLETIVSYAGELRIQMIQPLRPSPYVKHYPSWVSVGSGWVVLFWFCAAGGCLVIARRDPLLALFFFLVYWLVMFPAMTVHNVGDRIRLPVDLMFIPVTAVFLDWLARLLRTRVGKVRGRRASD
jgi:hypothetical protein